METTSVCTKTGVRKGSWSEEEDKVLKTYITKNGHGNWKDVPKLTGLSRCDKSCRLRWLNYLDPTVKRGNFTKEEVDIICAKHKLHGNRWSIIASHLQGRTDNHIKNYWHTHLEKKDKNKDHHISNKRRTKRDENEITTRKMPSSSIPYRILESSPNIPISPQISLGSSSSQPISSSTLRHSSSCIATSKNKNQILEEPKRGTLWDYDYDILESFSLVLNSPKILESSQLQPISSQTLSGCSSSLDESIGTFLEETDRGKAIKNYESISEEELSEDQYILVPPFEYCYWRIENDYVIVEGSSTLSLSPQSSESLSSQPISSRTSSTCSSSIDMSKNKVRIPEATEKYVSISEEVPGEDWYIAFPPFEEQTDPSGFDNDCDILESSFIPPLSPQSSENSSSQPISFQTSSDSSFLHG